MGSDFINVLHRIFWNGLIRMSMAIIPGVDKNFSAFFIHFVDLTKFVHDIFELFYECFVPFLLVVLRLFGAECNHPQHWLHNQQ